MRSFYQLDASFAEILEGKALRRDEFFDAVRQADPAVLALGKQGLPTDLQGVYSRTHPAAQGSRR